MEKILDRFESIADKIMSEVENKPITTAIKALIVYWVFKQIQKISKSW